MMLNFLLFVNSLLLLIIVVVAGGILFFVFKDRMPKTRKSSVKALRKNVFKKLDELEKVAKQMEPDSLVALTEQLENLLEGQRKEGENDD